MTTRTREDLKAALASPLEYELQMLIAPAARVGDDTLPADIHVACLESMLTHARNLLVFLAGTSSANDIHRSAFSDFQLAEGERAQANRIQSEISQYLSHLSWRRIEIVNADDQPEWLASIPGHVLSLLDQFSESLDAELRGALAGPLERAHAELEGPRVTKH